MHILIGLITAIATLLFALERIGVDIGWINPFSWARRRRWAKLYEGDPIHSVEDPIQVAAILIVGTAKLGDDVSTAQKERIIKAFADTFSLEEKAANELYISAAHLLGAPQVIETQLTGVVERNQDLFSASQAESLLDMIPDVIGAGSNETQRAFVAVMRSKLAPSAPEGSWA